jgi:hypothetical protein
VLELNENHGPKACYKHGLFAIQASSSNGMELVHKPIAQPQPKMPTIFLSTLKGQSFFQTSSSTHVHIFLPQFQCSNANL